MESIIIWGFALLVCAAIVVYYARNVSHGHRQNHEDRAEAKALGIDRPRAQHPMVDLSRCIGCGSCIAACPEGGVLGLINGKASIINGLRCVGHGRCAEACPVEAVTIGMGNVQHRDDLPRLDKQFQTNIPGLYIVGELGGLALIKNAIHQGTLAARAIAADRKRAPGVPAIPDLVVVGAGPAGLATALEAIRLGLKPLLLDRAAAGGTLLRYPRKKLVLTQPIEIPTYGWLRKPEYAKEALLEIWHESMARARLEVTSGVNVTHVQPVGDGFEVVSEQGRFSGRNVVLALGRGGTPRKLEVPGEDLPKIFYQLEDASQFQSDHLLVVGGGDSAVEAAMALGRQPGNTVTLSYRKHKFFRIKRRNAERLEQAVASGQVRLLTQSEVLAIRADQVLLQTPTGELELRNDYVFAFTGGIPPFALLHKCGIAFGMREEAA